MTVEIISSGTELTLGLTVDTNAAWLSARLAAMGLIVDRHITVPDNAGSIRDAVAQAAARAEYVLVTGGLGPTADDVTRQAVADAAHKPLVTHEPSVDRIRRFFARLGRAMPSSNERQALMPDGAVAIDNACGTAPGFEVRIADATVFVMPGVPHEMMAMFDSSVAPLLGGRSPSGVVVTRAVRCFGAGEADIGERIADLMVPGRNPIVGITASGAVITIRIVARGADVQEADALADDEVMVVRGRLGPLVFGRDDETLQEAVAQLLIDRGYTVATAESCSGGLLSKMLTDVPGSSAFFLGGFVTYANELKVRSIGVPAALIQTHGAVSEEVAVAMAQGCRRVTGADIGLSITGIAGPAGGTDDKPVGRVYIAAALESGTRCRLLHLGSHLTREAIRDRSCKFALNLVRLQLISDVND